MATAKSATPITSKFCIQPSLEGIHRLAPRIWEQCLRLLHRWGSTRRDDSEKDPRCLPIRAASGGGEPLVDCCSAGPEWYRPSDLMGAEAVAPVGFVTSIDARRVLLDHEFR